MAAAAIPPGGPVHGLKFVPSQHAGQKPSAPVAGVMNFGSGAAKVSLAPNGKSAAADVAKKALADAGAKSAPADQQKASVILRCRTAILADLDKFYTTELDECAAISKTGNPQERAGLTSHKILAGESFAAVSRPAHIKELHVLPDLAQRLAGLSVRQRACYDTILNDTVNTINKAFLEKDTVSSLAKYKPIYACMRYCEPYVGKNTENSLILQSLTVKTVQRIIETKAMLIALF